MTIRYIVKLNDQGGGCELISDMMGERDSGYLEGLKVARYYEHLGRDVELWKIDFINKTMETVSTALRKHGSREELVEE